MKIAHLIQRVWNLSWDTAFKSLQFANDLVEGLVSEFVENAFIGCVVRTFSFFHYCLQAERSTVPCVRI